MDRHSSDGEDRCPKRVLALDGGGVRGLTTLLILKRLMYLLGPNEDDYKLPKPCEYFDLIAGTSTGGIIAIMLGRLNMDVQTCIDKYKKLAKDVFVPRRRNLHGGRLLNTILSQATFDSTKLSISVEDMLTSLEPPLSKSAPLLAENSAKCKIFVCTTMENTRPLRLRSYTIGSEESVRCTIVDAVLATSAAFFDPIKINGIGATLRDGAFRANNPIQDLISEIEGEFSNWQIGCVVSIGTGVRADEQFGRSLTSVARICCEIALDTEEAHRKFRDRECKPGGRFRDKYFRFNVSQGLQTVGLEEWKEMETMWSKTYTYMQDVREELSNCVNCLQAQSEEGPRHDEHRVVSGLIEAPPQGRILHYDGDNPVAIPRESNAEGSMSTDADPEFSLTMNKPLKVRVRVS